MATVGISHWATTDAPRNRLDILRPVSQPDPHPDNRPDPGFFSPSSPPRREDPRLITGAGRFVGDIVLPGTIHLAFVRSTEAHAAITGIDRAAAASSPGVVGVFIAEDLALPDIPGDAGPISAPGFSRPHLASDRVRYVTEPVAVVAAESAVVAMDAADLVWVDYESLPVVADTDQALTDDTVIHQQAGTNVVERWEHGAPTDGIEHDVSAEVVLRNQRVAPTPIEPLGILAEPGEDGRLTVYLSHQRPHGARSWLAALLGLAPDQLRVVVPDVGGAFGMKGMAFPEYTITAALALRLNRPVRWIERRREELGGGTHGRGSTQRVRLAGRADGRIERAEIHNLADTGAYPHNGLSIPIFTRYVATGLYDIEDVWITSTTVVTNRAPTGSYRGAGRPEAAYAIERAVDAFARAAGLDVAEVRRKNFIAADALPFRTPTGALYDSGDYAQALARAEDLVDVDSVRDEQRRRLTDGIDPIGLGFGAFVERAGGRIDGGEYGRVEVDERGCVSVRSGSMAAGQGHDTVFSLLVAEALSVEPDGITFLAGDTDQVARGTGTFASRSAQMGASALWRTAHRVREAAISLAADMLEAAPADVVLAEGRFGVVGSPGRGLSWKEVAAEAAREEVELAAEEWYVPGAQTFPYGVHVAVVEVILETGEVRLLKMVTVDDCGRVLDPMIVEGQLQGSLMQGIGQALYEEVDYSGDGQLRTATLMDYELPRAGDAPPMISARLVHPAPSNPLGVKGTGEAGCIGAPPAVVNAALDALAPYGVTHLDMPLRPARVWEAIQRATGT